MYRPIIGISRYKAAALSAISQLFNSQWLGPIICCQSKGGGKIVIIKTTLCIVELYTNSVFICVIIISENKPVKAVKYSSLCSVVNFNLYYYSNVPNEKAPGLSYSISWEIYIGKYTDKLSV